MTKKDKSTFNIFTEAVGLYFSNIDKFIKYMSFPVLGQIFGLYLVFGTAYLYFANIDKLILKYPALNSFSSLLIISLLITLPGLAIFCKAFWEYLIAYGSVNSMLENMLKSGRVYDFSAHNELITSRSFSFIGLWFILGIFSIIGICPLFWIICGVLAIYFILVFQVFTFEPNLSPFGCIKKSFMLIKGHLAQTILLIVLVSALTYFLIPQLILKAFDGTGLCLLLTKSIMPFINLLPELHLEEYGMKSITHSDIGLIVIQSAIAQIFIQYTLPLRSIMWSLWYKELNKGLPDIEYHTKTTKKRKNSKRPSEKLMEATNKKYKLDKNIIKRAAEKDED